MPNVNPVTEMVDLIASSRSYEANVTAHADRQVHVLEDLRPAALMAILPIDPSSISSVGGSEWSVGVGIEGRRRRPRRAPARASAGCSRTRSRRSRRRRPRPREASQSLVNGTATDPTQVVMSVERARLAMQLASQIRTQGRRGLHGHLPHTGVTECRTSAPSIANMTPKGRLMIGGSAVAIVLLAFFMMRIAGQASYTTVMAGHRPEADRQGHRGARRQGDQVRGAEQRHRARRRQVPARRGAHRARREGPSRTAPSPASSCSTSRSSAPATSSSRSPTSARSRASSPPRSARSTASAAPPCSSCSRRTSSSTTSSPPRRRRCSCPATRARSQPGAIHGIAQLVSGSVKGLSSNNVSITDSTGALLWPNSEAGATDGQMAATQKQAAEARYSQGMEANLNAMLVQTLGPGKAQVQVNADLNADQTTLQEAHVRQEGRAAARPRRTDNETLKGGGGGAGGGGAAGTASNTVPSYAGAGGGGANSNYKHETGRRSYGVDKQVAEDPGRARRRQQDERGRGARQERAARVGRGDPPGRPRARPASTPERGDKLVGQPGRLRQAAGARQEAGHGSGARLRQVHRRRPRRCSPSSSSSPATCASARTRRCSASRCGCARSSRPRRWPSSSAGWTPTTTRWRCRAPAAPRRTRCAPSSRSWSTASPSASPTRCAPG